MNTIEIDKHFFYFTPCAGETKFITEKGGNGTE